MSETQVPNKASENARSYEDCSGSDDSHSEIVEDSDDYEAETVENSDSDLEEVQEQTSKILERFKQLKSEKAELMEDKAHNEALIKRLQSDYTKAEDELQAARAEIERLEGEIVEVTAERDDYLTKLQDADEEKDRRSKAIKDEKAAKTKAQALQKEAAELERRRKEIDSGILNSEPKLSKNQRRKLNRRLSYSTPNNE